VKATTGASTTSPYRIEVQPNAILGGDRQADVYDPGHPRTGSRVAGVAMAFKLIESAQAQWRAVNAPRLIALVRAGAKFENGQSRPNDPTDREVISKPRDQGGHETGRHVDQREPSGSGSGA
jgi:hypothetical protein